MYRILVTLLLGSNFALAHINGFCNLVWSDEFNGPSLSSDWTKEATCYGGGNGELECYTKRDKNVFMDNGNLVLKAYRETYTGSNDGCTDSQGCTWTKPYTSGRVNTAASKSFLHGRFEISAKLPSGSHLWPAIWMLPTDYSYGGWAASGEIDIMESRGDHPNLISGTLHHGAPWPNNVWTTTGDHNLNNADLSQDFHVYAVEWTQNTMKWFIDDYNFQTYDLNRWWNGSVNGVYSAMGQPWDRRFHFILNLAVGGNFFGGYPALTDADSAAWKSSEMRVDYVRAYSQGGDCSNADNANRPSTSTSASSSSSTSAPLATSATSSSGASDPDLEECGTSLYDASQYACLTNQDSGLPQLCPLGTLACGSSCYDAADFTCARQSSGFKVISKILKSVF